MQWHFELKNCNFEWVGDSANLVERFPFCLPQSFWIKFKRFWWHLWIFFSIQMVYNGVPSVPKNSQVQSAGRTGGNSIIVFKFCSLHTSHPLFPTWLSRKFWPKTAKLQMCLLHRRVYSQLNLLNLQITRLIKQS